jgi:hypothetical protein
MEATHGWDGVTERRAGIRSTRRKADKVPVVAEKREGGLFPLIVGIGIGALAVMAWAGLAWLLG